MEKESEGKKKWKQRWKEDGSLKEGKWRRGKKLLQGRGSTNREANLNKGKMDGGKKVQQAGRWNWKTNWLNEGSEEGEGVKLKWNEYKKDWNGVEVTWKEERETRGTKDVYIKGIQMLHNATFLSTFKICILNLSSYFSAGMETVSLQFQWYKSVFFFPIPVFASK